MRPDNLTVLPRPVGKYPAKGMIALAAGNCGVAASLAADEGEQKVALWLLLHAAGRHHEPTCRYQGDAVGRLRQLAGANPHDETGGS